MFFFFFNSPGFSMVFRILFFSTFFFLHVFFAFGCFGLAFLASLSKGFFVSTEMWRK